MKDITSSLTLNLASFAKLEQFLEARRDSSTAEAAMNFEEFEAACTPSTFWKTAPLMRALRSRPTPMPAI